MVTAADAAAVAAAVAAAGMTNSLRAEKNPVRTARKVINIKKHGHAEHQIYLLGAGCRQALKTNGFKVVYEIYYYCVR